MANNSPDLISNWFKTAAEITEATMRATAQVQLDNLDLWMEAMTGAARADTPPEETPFLSSMMRNFGGREASEGQSDASIVGPKKQLGPKKREQAKPRDQAAGKAQGDRSRHAASRKAGASRAHSSAKSGSRSKAKHARRR